MTYAFHKKVTEEYRGSDLIKVHIAKFTVRKGSKHVFLRTSVPCRSRLYKLLTHFYFKGHFSQNEAYVSITEEDLKVLKVIVKHRKKYNIWKEAYKLLEVQGTEVAKDFVETKVHVLRLADVTGNQ